MNNLDNGNLPYGFDLEGQWISEKPMPRSKDFAKYMAWKQKQEQKEQAFHEMKKEFPFEPKKVYYEQ